MTTSTSPALPTVTIADGPAAAAAALTVSDALDIVHELACLNQIDEFEASGDALLAAQGAWQRKALDALWQILFERGEEIDRTFALPSLALCAPVPDWLCSVHRELDPRVPSNAVRICLELAGDAALEAAECGTEPLLVAGRVRQQRAFAMARAFLGLHGEAFDAAFATQPGSAGVTSVAARPARGPASAMN